MNDIQRFQNLSSKLVSAIQAQIEEVVFKDSRIDNNLLRAEALRYFTRVFGAGLVSQLEAHDPSYPSFIKILSPWLNWGYPNPDGTYTFSAIHGDYDYRIFGTRGSARLFDIEVWDGDIADLKNARSIGGLRNIFNGKSDMHINEDGSFEVILSKDKKEGNWIKLSPSYGHLYIRQWFYDYETEQPGSFHIERIGASYPRPALTAETHIENIERLTQYLESVFETCHKGISLHYADAPDIVPFPPGLINSELEGQIAFRKQSYGRGRFYCEPDQAVIIEVEPPKAEYWMFGLLSPFWESYDWLGRQISINGFQAVIDEDGIFRAVIAHRDPGLPNWLDACGHNHGLIAARYNWSDNIPIPKLRTVALSSLREELPKSTPHTSPAERHQILHKRVLSQRNRPVDW